MLSRKNSDLNHTNPEIIDTLCDGILCEVQNVVPHSCEIWSDKGSAGYEPKHRKKSINKGEIKNKYKNVVIHVGSFC